MPAAIHNFFIEQGSNFEIIFEYFDENQDPIVISNSDCVRLRLKDSNNQYRVWRNLALSTGSILTIHEDPTLSANQIKWSLPADTTKKFIFDSAVYSLDLVIGGNESNSIKLATGQIAIIRDVFLTECETGDVSGDFRTCVDCESIVASYSEGISTDIVPSPTPGGVTLTPTPSLSFGITPTPSASPVSFIQEDLCDYLCKGLDIFSQLYTGSGIVIPDATVISGVNTPSSVSGQIFITNTGIAKNIELYVDNLVHDNPSDLTMLVRPPSGDPILLSYRNKINNYNKQSGVRFAFSNKAIPGIYLNNKSNSNDLYVNILETSGVTLPSPFNTSYQYSFDHLFDAAPGALSGNWDFCILDHDYGGSGSLNAWNLIITYQPPTYNENE